MKCKQTNPSPGVYPHSHTEYFDWPYVSSTDLKALLKSPAHFKEQRRVSKKDTRALRIGRMFHELVLDKYEKDDGTCEAPESKGAAAEFSLAKKMAESAEANELIAKCLNMTSPENREVAIVWDDEDTGVRCKALLDSVIPNTIIWDLKSAEDASDRGCQDAFVKFDYWLQASHYTSGAKLLGLNPKEFWFFFVEKTAPYLVNWMPVDQETIEYGMNVRSALLQTYKDCEENDSWPGYYRPAKAKSLYIPDWKKRQIGEV